jgi:tetrahydromethanopterin S-methyltransferase subunit B
MQVDSLYKKIEELESRMDVFENSIIPSFELRRPPTKFRNVCDFNCQKK